MNDYPHIFTFYSFKGGVGRSMAVLNVAYALAAKGRNVLVLDMDLEAPGLSGFLHRHQEIERFADRDMVDLIRWANTVPVPADDPVRPTEPLSFPPLTDFAVPIPSDKLGSIPRKYSELARLDFIPVEEGRDYYDRLTELGMGNYDQEALVRTGSVLRAWLKSLRFPVEVPNYYGPNAERTAPYDYILVDSRTGISETGGLCIGPLSDQLVVLTALNDQNVKGTQRFLVEVGILEGPSALPSDPQPTAAGVIRRPDAKPTHLVASLVPVGEIEMKRDRLKILEQALGKTVVALSYHPRMALLESIFTRDYREENLAREYDILLRHILRSARDGETEDSKEYLFNESKPTPESRGFLEKLLRKTQVEDEIYPLRYRLYELNPEQLTEDVDYILWDRICRTLSDVESSARFTALNAWANLLSEWAFRSKDTELASLRSRESEGKYAKIFQTNEFSPSQKCEALFDRASVYGKRSERDKQLDDYAAALAIPDAPAEQRANALVYRGMVYGKLGERDKQLDDYAAVLAMPDVPIDQRVNALVSRSWALYEANQITEAVDDARNAISIWPSDCRSHANLGIFLLVLGQESASMAEYGTALDLADTGELEEMRTDLQEAITRNPGLFGAEEAMLRIEARFKALRALDTHSSA